MRKALLLLSIAIIAAGCGSESTTTKPQKTDVEKARLKGAVKSIKDVVYNTKKAQNGEFEASEIASDIYSEYSIPKIVNYNEKGMLTIEQILSNSGDIIGEKTVTYNEQGDITRLFDTGAQIDVIDYTYDDKGRLAKVQSPDQAMVNIYSYDNKGRLATMTSNDTYVTTYTYDDKGKLTEERTINKETNKLFSLVKHNYTAEGSFNGREYELYEYSEEPVVKEAYNSLGLIMRKHDINFGDETKYEYNENGDLISTENDMISILFSYKYDEKGNWIERYELVEDPMGTEQMPILTKRTIEYYN